ncbi:hypothetical protein KY284_032297 [Solanum tuberosum]|nr:hypothetical protein KY284_032297 [Solanum tuberosum]
MKAKYCHRVHPSVKAWTSGNSQAWKFMVNARHVIEPNILWKINSGSCNMWWDNWCEKGPLAILYPDHVHNNNAKDGEYTNSSAWQSIREVRQKDAILRKWVQICTRIERYKPIVRWRQVVWTKPATGRIKFNTDGSYMQESISRAGIGGVLRDDTGHLIMAFSVATQCKSNNQAEAMVALYAIKWCNRAGYDKYDLMVITNMLEEKDTNNLKLKNIIKRTVNTMEGEEVSISHCYREANQVADFLAKLASSSGNGTFYFSYQQLSKEAKGLFQLDRWQLPCIRRRYDKYNFFVS